MGFGGLFKQDPCSVWEVHRVWEREVVRWRGLDRSLSRKSIEANLVGYVVWDYCH